MSASPLAGAQTCAARPLRVMVLYGTRPGLIKMAPLVRELQRSPDSFKPILCTTAQHRDMLDQMQEVFGFRPDFDLNLMRADQSLKDLTARAFAELDSVLASEAPELLLVQGDTTTAMVGALAAFHRRVPVGHVEAGLRTGDLARWRLAPSGTAEQHMTLQANVIRSRHHFKQG